MNQSTQAPSRNPRILHYICSRVRAGAEEHALSILAALPDRGFEPYFAGPTPLIDAMASDFKAAGIKAIPIDIAGAFDLRSHSRFAAALRREQIDVVHSHMFISSFFASPIARLAGVPIVIETNHGREVWRQSKRMRGKFWVDRQIARLTDRIIAVSHAAARHLRATKGIPDHKIQVIHNGRDLTLFHPPIPDEVAAMRAELGLRDEPALLVSGRLDTQKGHIYLIEAMGQLKDRWPRLIALFAGSGPLEAQLRARADALGIGDRIRYLGFRNDAQRLFAAADISVLPSLYEGLPLVAIEALAAASPMVATAVEGTPEVVVDNETGLLVPPANPGELAGAIDRLLANPALARELGRRGRKWVEDHFDIRMQLDQTVAVYREFTGQSMRRAA